MLEDLLSLLGGHWATVALCAPCQATHEAAALWAGGAAFLEGITEPSAGCDAIGEIVGLAAAIMTMLQQRGYNVDQIRALDGQSSGCAMAQGVGEY